MKAPDKIYRRLKGPNIYYSDFKPAKIRNDEPDAEEYIRKDALMEWLESKVYEHNEDRFDDGFNAALGQVIDKLNEM